jgi:undecaprenyl diphosphate synthase
MDIDKMKSKYLPKHVAIIMDGNGRWAKSQGKERIFGHQQGVDTVRKIVEIAVEIGIEYLSLFAFSTENWNRPKEEVDALMELLIMGINRELPDIQKNNIRIATIGEINRLPQHCIDAIENSKKITENNTRMTLCIAISYSGRWDIVETTKKIAAEVQKGKIKIEDINESLFSKNTSSHHLPDPELLIRTSGEQRISNFYLWQLAYTEIYNSTKHWPAFTKEDFIAAINDFQNRERRFGLTSEQLKK